MFPLRTAKKVHSTDSSHYIVVKRMIKAKSHASLDAFNLEVTAVFRSNSQSEPNEHALKIELASHVLILAVIACRISELRARRELSVSSISSRSVHNSFQAFAK